MRHRGAVVDVEQRRVCDRDGEWYPFDRLEVAGTTLYYARPLNFRVLKYHERWLIADEGWSVSRFQFTPNEPDPVGWYIEMELIDVEGALWTVRDGYLDMFVWEGQRARRDDADELGDGLADGSISVDEAAAASAHSTDSATSFTRTATRVPPSSRDTLRTFRIDRSTDGPLCPANQARWPGAPCNLAA